MKYDMFVALGGPVFSYYLDHGSVTEAEASYDQRPQALVVADGTDTLRAVINAAAECFGYTLREREPDAEYWPSDVADAIDFIGFYDGTDDVVHYQALTTLNTSGEVVWGRRWHDITVSDLKFAHAQGLVPGDITRPYFIPQESAGDFGGVNWSPFLDLLTHLPGWIRMVGEYGDGVGTLTAAYLGGRKVVKKVWTKWANRGGSILDVADVVCCRARTTDETAALLGIRPDHVRVLLPLLGLAEDGDGYWRATEPTTALSQIWTVMEAALGSGLISEVYNPTVVREAFIEALRYTARGGRDEQELQAMFARRMNPNWDPGGGWVSPE